jgi:hypothetical protein
VLKSHWLRYKRARTMDELSVVMDAAPLDFITDFFDPAPLVFVKLRARAETNLTSASLATVVFLQECGQYIWTDCCVRERMTHNLDLDNESFCLDWYQRGTRRVDFERHVQARLEFVALVYHDQRPPADGKADRLPKPSTLLTDRSSNGLWVGGTRWHRQPVHPPCTAERVDVHVLGDQRVDQDRRERLLQPHREFPGHVHPRAGQITVMDPHTRRVIPPLWAGGGPILIRHYAVVPGDTFVLPELLECYDTNSGPDEEGDSDCELLD